MDTKFQSSFIPKKPVLESSSRSSHLSGGIFYILAEIVFAFTILGSLAVFGYQKLLEAQINKMQGDLTTATENAQPELIHQLSRASARFQSAQAIINSHVTISRLFDLLESLTLQTVRFNDFSYSTDQSGVLQISMSGEARSYATIALQSDIFLKDGSFKTSQFSNLDLNSKGNVIFAFKGRVDPSVTSYIQGLKKDAQGGVQSSNPVTPAITINQPSASTTSESVGSTTVNVSLSTTTATTTKPKKP